MPSIIPKIGKEVFTSNGGLLLLGQIILKCGLSQRLDSLEPKGRPDRTPASSIGKSLCALISTGCLDYEKIEGYRDDEFFKESLGLKVVPSAATLRQRTEAICGATNTTDTDKELKMADAVCHKIETAVRDSMVDVMKNISTPISALILSESGRIIPVDMDTTVMEEPCSSKENIGYTYQKVMGFTPMFSYIGREGYILDAELRPGVQHSQKGTPAAIHRARGMARRFVQNQQRLLWRLDGGCDAAETVEAIEADSRDSYIIVHNRRKETPELWLAIAKRRGIRFEPRPGKTVWIGETSRYCGNMGRRRCVFRVTRRTTDCHGQYLITPQIEVRLFWTNLPESPVEIIDLYADHGTSEQFHSEYKTDLNMERFPSSDYRVNRVLLLLGAFVFNALRQIGQESLRTEAVPIEAIPPMDTKVQRRRIRTVIDNFIRIAGRLIHSGREMILSLGKTTVWVRSWLRIYSIISMPVKL